MKKTYFLIIILVLLTTGIKSQETKYIQLLPDIGNNIGNDFKDDLFILKSWTWKWDTIICYDTLGLIYRLTQKLDTNGNTMSILSEELDSSLWINNWKNTYSYDTNGRLFSLLKQIAQGGSLTNYSRFFYYYDTDGKLFLSSCEFWQNHAWQGCGSHYYVYGRNGLLLYDYDDYTKNLYAYNNDGSLQFVISQTWQSGAWVNLTRADYSYDIYGNLLTIFKLLWLSNNTWNDQYMKEYRTYDLNGNLITRFITRYSCGDWRDDVRYTYTYDNNGNRLTEFREDNDWVNVLWTNTYIYHYSYDLNGNSINGIYEIWANGNWEPGMNNLSIFSQRTSIYSIPDKIFRYTVNYTYYNSSTAGIGIDNSFFQIYPNPTIDNFTILDKSLNPINEKIISIFDIHGKLLLRQTMQQDKTEIDISSLDKGVYIVRVLGADMNVTKKIIKE
jgi:hypothetical protein